MSNVGGHKGDTTKCYCGILDWVLKQKKKWQYGKKNGEHLRKYVVYLIVMDKY